MKFNRLYLAAALSPMLVLAAGAQPAPPAPAPPPADASTPPPPPLLQAGSATTRSSRVNTVIYGPQGEIQALTLRDGVVVTLPPDLASRLQSSIIRGRRIQVSGVERVIAGQASLVAQSLTANGQIFSAMPARPGTVVGITPPPPRPGGPGGPEGPGAPLGLVGPPDRRGPTAPPPPAPNGATPPPPAPALGNVDAPPPPPPNRAAPPPPPPQM